MNQEFSASIPFSWKVSMFSICKCSGDKSKWGAAAATTPTRGRSESKCREISLKFASHSTPSSQPVACMHACMGTMGDETEERVARAGERWWWWVSVLLPLLLLHLFDRAFYSKTEREWKRETSSERKIVGNKFYTWYKYICNLLCSMVMIMVSRKRVPHFQPCLSIFMCMILCVCSKAEESEREGRWARYIGRAKIQENIDIKQVKFRSTFLWIEALLLLSCSIHNKLRMCVNGGK